MSANRSQPGSAPRPTLPLADVIKIQRFAKRTPPPIAVPGTTGTGPRTAPVTNSGTTTGTEPPPSGSESEDILNYFPPDEAALIREEAALCDVSVNYMVADFAKLGYKTAWEQTQQNEPNYDIIKR